VKLIESPGASLDEPVGCERSVLGNGDESRDEGAPAAECEAALVEVEAKQRFQLVRVSLAGQGIEIDDDGTELWLLEGERREKPSKRGGREADRLGLRVDALGAARDEEEPRLELAASGEPPQEIENRFEKAALPLQKVPISIAWLESFEVNDPESFRADGREGLGELSRAHPPHRA
jgi:hypothetical protein